MKKALIGKKVGMTQIFDENGTVIPVTVIEAGPCVVAQVKTIENDGYEAVQLGFGEVKENKLNKPVKGHFAKANVTAKKHLREFRLDSIEGIKVGDELKADVIKNQIINQDFEITLDTMEQYISKIPNNKKDIEKLLKDKNAKKVLIEEDDPLIQQLVSTFSNQKLAQTIDATNKLIQYMSEIDKLRNKKDK